MKLVPALLVALALSTTRSLPAEAQAASPPVEEAAPDSVALIKGFALAHITEPGGQTHWVYVPAGQPGFVRMLPFYRHKEEVRAFGQPWSISVDKVQKMRVYGVHYEHMVVQGKHKHLLAARVANGPVELFNYTETTQVLPASVVGAVVAGAILAGTAGEGIAERRWFLRRGGELVQVRRGDFAAQLSEYFKDDSATVAAVTQQQLRYPDMLALVQAYNQRRLAGSH
ncbi:MAG: hypothetical protein EOO59_02105 [Hymenobacter sp.]|nr:MAG: hypothetical protein EOO59_02105 [Hymenobacter sp.]